MELFFARAQVLSKTIPATARRFDMLKDTIEMSTEKRSCQMHLCRFACSFQEKVSYYQR